MEKIWESICETLGNKISPIVLFGKRWIFFVGASIILLLYWAFTVLLKVNPADALLSPIFIGGSIATIAISVVIYLYLTRPPNDDVFRIVVAAFVAASDDENARKEAKNMRDRLLEKMEDRALSEDAHVLVKPVEEAVDVREANWHKRAKELAREYRAHMVLGAKVRFEEDYYVKPFIVTRFHHPFEVSLANIRLGKEPAENARSRLLLKEIKTGQEAALAALVTGLAKITTRRYEDARRILDSIPDTSVVWFYRGFAKLKMAEREKQRAKEEAREMLRDALHCFEEACKLDGDYSEAWRYQGFTLQSLDEKKKAQECFEKAHAAKGSLPDEAVQSDTIKRSLEALSDVFGKVNDAFRDVEQADKALVPYLQGCDHMQREEYAEAVALFNHALELYPRFALQPQRALALAKLGRKEAARAALQSADDAKQETSELTVARAYALLGDKALMLESLVAAIEAEPTDASLLSVYHEFDPFRDDPDLKKILEKTHVTRDVG